MLKNKKCDIISCFVASKYKDKKTKIIEENS